jgi:hypothetical protein
MAIIIIAVIVVALYFVPKKDSETKASAITPTVSDTQSTLTDDESGPTDAALPKTTREVGEPTVIVARVYKIFIDTNNNQQRDGSELDCGLCVAKGLITARSQNLQQGNPALVTIHASGALPDNEMRIYNLAWGLFDDRQVIIPEFSYSPDGDGTDSINIPAYEYKLLVNSVNANYIKGEISGNKVTYIFTALLPAFQSAAQSGKPVWVRYTPNLANLDIYYLASGRLVADTNGVKSDSSQGYYLEVTWSNFPDKAGINKKENLDFVLL